MSQEAIALLLANGLTAVVGVFFCLLGLVYMVVAGVVIYKLLLKKPKSMPVIALVSLFTCSFPAFFIAIFFATAKLRRIRDNLYAKVYTSPNDEVVREVIDFYTNFYITNRPEEWQAARNLWHAINQSSNVSTELKRQVLGALLSKGLYLSEAEKRIRN